MKKRILGCFFLIMAHDQFNAQRPSQEVTQQNKISGRNPTPTLPKLFLFLGSGSCLAMYLLFKHLESSPEYLLLLPQPDHISSDIILTPAEANEKEKPALITQDLQILSPDPIPLLFPSAEQAPSPAESPLSTPKSSSPSPRSMASSSSSGSFSSDQESEIDEQDFDKTEEENILFSGLYAAAENSYCKIFDLEQENIVHSFINKILKEGSIPAHKNNPIIKMMMRDTTFQLLCSKIIEDKKPIPNPRRLINNFFKKLH